MKKVLSIILIAIVIVNLFLIVGCYKTDTENDSQSEVETPDNSDDTKPNSQPVAIKTVNGMTLIQLYENFIEEYTKAATLDISIITDITSEGIQTNSSLRLKLTDDAMYIMVDADDTELECWFLEDSSYLNIAGEKHKNSNVTVDDIFGEGFIELSLSSVANDVDNSVYSKKLENAQLYTDNDEYCCDLKFTVEEAEALDMEAEAFTETLFFDAQGKIKKIVHQSSTEKTTIVLHSYGDTLSVSAPADADSYIEQTIPDDDGENDQTQPPVDFSGVQDPLLYAEYQRVFEAINNAQKFQMMVTTKGSTVLFYTVVGNNEYTRVLENGVYFDRWYVNGKGYVCENDGTAVSTAVTESFLSYFNSAKDQKDFVVGLQLHGNDMNDFSVLKEYSYSQITLTHNNTDGTIDFYEIQPHYSNGKVNSVHFTITRSLNGEQIFSTGYVFLEIDSVYMEDIVAPI